jgi:ABC-type dipeptide/oligopeptide/nickel transport system permease component
LDIVLWGVIGGVPLALWIVMREDMKLKSKIAKFVFLAISIPLLVFSPLFIFHTEFEEPPSTFPPVDYSYAVQQMWIRTYYIIFGLFLFIVGFVLIVASYYHHEET